ncbi:phosphonoacetaldehyde hydrolase [Enterococcus pallens]|uniref:Phosphonoacetaldehyde hydrolase n=1 Tax=Enterococcus pallens ATCC BAA-351 TaxID=1158607 RepID=R2SHL6_9ENTE|nr:phosphonoacetaldehyde hydrolase [Enterococcus pallens]EOH87679.1 phosphonoacetaldehyde hydrolase [Enterococcus pallens ATCC BAA-351]EOU17893.1 phosphonoacetaldehyde hydrolase [Enterococcus pallens ATCC BAA-351]
MSVKTIIFDWAGTTVDFGCMAPVIAFKKAFAEKGITLSLDEIREPMGKLKREHIKILLDLPSVQEQWLNTYQQLPQAVDAEALYKRFEAFLFEDLAEYSTLKPETAEVIQQLQANGFNIGSTTGYTSEMMKVVTEAAKKSGYQPDFMITPDAVGNLGRPYPYMIYQNMQYFKNQSVTEVVKVGDTITDIQEGKNAGVFTIAVVEGSSEMGLSLEEYTSLSVSDKEQLIQKVMDRFYQAGADLCILNLTELLDYFIHDKELLGKGSVSV